MALIDRIKRLEKLAGRQQTTLLKVPSDWEEFCKLTEIRSGGSMKKFELYPYQKLLIDLANKYPNLIVLKSRQLGITQAILAKFLHDACINSAASSILFLRNGDDASAISRRARQMLNSIPEYATASNDSVGYLKIKNGGDLYFKNSGREGSRSLDSATGFLFDEAAFVENIQQIYGASSPSGALSQNVKKFVVSTPSARSGWYWDKLSENNSDDIEQLAIEVAAGRLKRDLPGCYWFMDGAGCCKVILHWRAHPIYREIPNYLAYRLKQDGTDEETISREYDLRFVDSAVAVFDSQLVKEGAIGHWGEYDPDERYYAGLDTATTGNDYVAFSIIGEKDGVYSLRHLYRKRQQESEYHIYQIGKLIERYEIRKIGIEVTGGVGQLYLEQLQRKHPEATIEPIRTTGDSKPAMIANLVLALERRRLTFPENSPLTDEFLGFRREGKKLGAAPGKHDDCVMSLAFSIAITPFAQRQQTSFDFTKLR